MVPSSLPLLGNVVLLLRFHHNFALDENQSCLEWPVVLELLKYDEIFKIKIFFFFFLQLSKYRQTTNSPDRNLND